jgi:hypothetical protein
MLHHKSNAIKEYREKLREMPHVPITTYHRDLLGNCGDEHKTTLTFLFSNRNIGNQSVEGRGIISQ